MKRKIFSIAFFAITLIGCNCEESASVESPKRISLVESSLIDGHLYSIIKVDTSEFFIAHNGGIIRLN
mgnify:FL=1